MLEIEREIKPSQYLFQETDNLYLCRHGTNLVPKS